MRVRSKPPSALASATAFGAIAIASGLLAVVLAVSRGNLTPWVAVQLWTAALASAVGVGGVLVANRWHWTSVPVLFAGLYVVFLTIGSMVGLATAPADRGTAMMLALGLLAFGAGSWVSARLLTQRWPAPDAIPVDAPRSSLRLYVPVAGFLVCLGISIWLFAANGIPFLAEQPNLAYVAWAEKAGRLLVALEFGLPISSLVILYEWRNRGRGGVVIGVAAIAIASALLLTTSRRYQLFDLYLALAFTFVLLPRVSIPRWISFGVVGLGLIVLVAVPLIRDPTLITSPGAGGIVRAAWFDTAHRIFGVEADGVRLLAETIPDRQPFFAGYTFRDELIRLPGQPTQFSLGRWLFRVRFEGQVPDSEIVGYYPPTAPGELYANFGWPGVILGMGAWGLLVQLVCGIAWRFRRQGSLLPVAGFAATYLVQGQLLGVYTTLQAIAWASLLTLAMTWLPARIDSLRRAE